jgi:hypothetical protein
MEKNKPSRAKKTSIPKMTERRNCHMRIFLKILDLGSSHSPFLPLEQPSFFVRDMNVYDLRLQTNCHHAPLIDLCCDVQLTRPAQLLTIWFLLS